MAEKKLLGSGNIRKLRTQLQDQVQYSLPLGDTEIAINPLIGQRLAFEFAGQINCVHCKRLTKKSFNQGYCYPCFTKLAECDSCIMSPEKCHYHLGTCRDNAWAETHCMIDHIVYLANSTGPKVGITRASQIPTRWMDQGAIQAIPMIRTKSRYLSGLVEVVFKQFVADKTKWQAMLKNHVEPLDLQQEKERLLLLAMDAIKALQAEHGADAIVILDTEVEDTESIEYPVLQYPEKVTAFNLDKTAYIEGVLQGIKGQYLIFDTGVINIRKFSGYLVSLYSFEPIQ